MHDEHCIDSLNIGVHNYTVRFTGTIKQQHNTCKIRVSKESSLVLKLYNVWSFESLLSFICCFYALRGRGREHLPGAVLDMVVQSEAGVRLLELQLEQCLPVVPVEVQLHQHLAQHRRKLHLVRLTEGGVHLTSVLNPHLLGAGGGGKFRYKHLRI